MGGRLLTRYQKLEAAESMTTRREFLALGALGLGGCFLEARPAAGRAPPARPARPRRCASLSARARHRAGRRRDRRFHAAPGAKVWLAGYGPNRPMKRISDPIGAQCLVVDDGARRVALVMVDVVGLMHPTFERIRKLVGPSIEVIVASTHNHASPDTIRFWGPAVMYASPIAPASIPPTWRSRSGASRSSSRAPRPRCGPRGCASARPRSTPTA